MNGLALTLISALVAALGGVIAWQVRRVVEIGEETRRGVAALRVDVARLDQKLDDHVSNVPHRVDA